MVTKHNRYQSLPDLASRLSQVHHHSRVISKRVERMMKKIEKMTEQDGITLDEGSHNGILSTMQSSEAAQFVDSLPEDSFRQLFWKQQLKAASQKNARTMRWHPLMIRWCLSLRHR